MDLEKERVSLIAQKDNAYMTYQQAIGALALLDAILADQKREVSMTVDQLKDVVGAKTLSIKKV